MSLHRDDRPNNLPPGIQAALQRASDEISRDTVRGGGQRHHRGPHGGGRHGHHGRYDQGPHPHQAGMMPPNQFGHHHKHGQHHFHHHHGRGNHPPPFPSVPPVQPHVAQQQALQGMNHGPQLGASPSLAVDQPSRHDGSQSTGVFTHPHTVRSHHMNYQATNLDSMTSPPRGMNQGNWRGSHAYGPQIRSPTGLPPIDRGGRRGRGGRHGPHGRELRLFNPHDSNDFGHRPNFNHESIMIQIRYLDHITSRELRNVISEKELNECENFRKKIERILQDMIRDWAKDNVTVNPSHVKLRCYGSMANGFAVPGSDVDLLLTFPKDEGPIGPIETECPRMFEKALLDQGYGARLLTKTRVPILRVCQRPGQDLLTALREYRLKSLEQDKEEIIERTMKDLGLKANRLPDDPSGFSANVPIALDIPASIPLPPSPTQEHASIEFDKSAGVQCDINFSNAVALYNSRLLRCYCICDDRVRQLGLVVKAWTKARKINTPYHGTLSSYGYILMVLHFLLNIANPPVIPNLQTWAKAGDSREEKGKDVPLFEGFDVRFMGDEKKLERMSAAGELTRNQESVGSLLRGFFKYYADPRGFHFNQEIVSIRSPSGILLKTSKGWTEAKRAGDDKSIRLRYLLCIEDPFEVEHNVARTVGHSGIVAIRDEFRRARDIINKIEFAQGSSWEWRNPDGSVGEDLFAPAEDRGDLLKKDADYHREKIRAAAKLRQEQEQAKRANELEPQPSNGQDEKQGSIASMPKTHHEEHAVPETPVGVALDRSDTVIAPQPAEAPHANQAESH